MEKSWKNSNQVLTENSSLVYFAGNASPAYSKKEGDSSDPVTFLLTPRHYGKEPWGGCTDPMGPAAPALRDRSGSAEVLRHSPVPAAQWKSSLGRNQVTPGRLPFVSVSAGNFWWLRCSCAHNRPQAAIWALLLHLRLSPDVSTSAPAC